MYKGFEVGGVLLKHPTHTTPRPHPTPHLRIVQEKWTEGRVLGGVLGGVWVGSWGECWKGKFPVFIGVLEDFGWGVGKNEKML